jgi:hypothetical protein
MKKTLLKTTFIISVFALTLVFLFPANLLLDAVLPARLDEHGHLRTMDALFPGFVVMSVSLIIANRIISFLFLSAHLSEERWSIFESRRSRRLG